MVFESVAQIVLSKFLDKFFYGINEKNIQFGLLDGKFVLSNIGLQPSLLTSLNLPIELKYSYVERVQINLPWREEQAFISINISNIYVLMAARPHFEDDVFDIFMKKKQQVIEQALKQFKSNLQRKEKKEYGYIEKLLIKLLDNVVINIQCIHLRYENPKQRYSFGVKVNEVSAKTVGQQDQQQYFNREKSKEDYVRYTVEMDFMGIYFNSKEDFFLQRKSLAEITDQFHRISHKNYKSYTENLDSEQSQDNFHYILTISLKTYLKKYVKAVDHALQRTEQKLDRKGKAENYLFECVINLNRIESHITDEQYYDILDVINFFSEYQHYYQYFLNNWQLSNPKDKKGKDIAQLLRKKKNMNAGKREKDLLKRHCHRYIVWVFKLAYEEALKRKFIKEAIKKQITVKHLMANKKLVAIANKVDNEKLKLWILISLYYRKKYEEKVNVFVRSNSDRINAFYQANFSTVDFFSPLEFEDEIVRMRETSSDKYPVFLKLNVNIKEFTCEISKEDTFGVSFKIDRLKTELILREKNYLLSLSMEDLQADVFNCKKYQKLKTYVPIIKRNCVLDRSVDLLQIQYERRPAANVLAFAEIEVHFQSIEITIYPEAFKQFYQILLGDSESKKKKKKKDQKRESVEQNYDSSRVRQTGGQKIFIKGKIKSPWVVLPLSTNNDLSKQCWVVRLGDLEVSTPEYNREELFYERYKLELKQFELNYFSSINFFHNWQKFNESLESLYRMRVFQKQKKITMIEPFSCAVDLSILKSVLSPGNRQLNYKFMSSISIDEINIKISKFLLTKLKSRWDLFFSEGREELSEFIETNIANIQEQNDLSGYCKVSYGGLKKVNFYCVLKGNFMYFFINEDYPKYHFFLNINEVAIRLISNEVEHFNEDRPSLVCFYLDDRLKHQTWRKKILHLLNRKDRKMDATFLSTVRETGSEKELQMKKKASFGRGDTRNEQDQVGPEGNMKINLVFLMNKLSIKLIDESNEQFLSCLFRKATFIYNVMHEKQMRFSLNEWIVNQTNKDMVFLSSRSFFDEEEGESSHVLNNFLEIKFKYNEITAELQAIVVEVDKLFLAWKVELFTKILLFFFYEQAVGDAPAPINYNKSQLQILINFRKFNFYCYFDEELIALTMLQFITIRYMQNSLEESYDVRCKIFEIDKYVNNDRSQRLPVVKRRQVAEGSPENELVQNNFNLYYVFRKKQTEAFPNICRLKKQLGEDILVTQTTCDWKDTVVYFENQLTFRVLNYILSKVLGTVAAKFKRKDYSPNYIFEAMKLRKLSVMDIRLNNMVFRIPPHERGFREFSLSMDQLSVRKNIDDLFEPVEVQVPTIGESLKFFHESMVFKFANVQLNYHLGQEPGIALHHDPFDINLIYAKLNFQKEYFVILKHHDDIDRKATVDVIIEQPVMVESYKIMFVSFLQIFYQNLKHKDGKGDKFESPLPFPSLRQYNVYIQKVGFNMYNFNERTQKMESFNRSVIKGFKIDYQQMGSQGQMKLIGESISSEGELPIFSLDSVRNKFHLQINTKQGQMRVVINAEHYALQVNLDNLNNIMEFINYDNDYVINKVMPKKPSSWQYVNVFAKNCEIRLSSLRASGQFYISYLKGMKNEIELEAKKYLLEEQQFEEVTTDPTKLNWSDLTDKEIKVNGSELRLSIDGDAIAAVDGFCFHRIDITSKASNKRFKRETVQVGEGSIYIQPTDLLTIWKCYNSNIRKNSSFVLKTLFEPWDTMTPKLKAVEKRSTEVEIHKLGISILPSLQSHALLYLRIDLQFPQIFYRTYLDEQQVIVNIRCSVFHNKEKLKQVQICDCRHFKLRYMNFKDRKEKWVEILNGKNILFNVYQLNNRILADIIEEMQTIKKITRKTIHSGLEGRPKKYSITVKNDLTRRVRLKIGNLVEFNLHGRQSQSKEVEIVQMLSFFNNPTSVVQFLEEGFPIVRIMNTELNVYSPTALNNNVLVIEPKIHSTVITYRSPFMIRNESSCLLFVVAENRLLKNQESMSVILQNRPNLIEVYFRSTNWEKRCEIDIRKSSQFIGDECFCVSINRQSNDTTILVRDRFVVKNMLAQNIQINGREVVSFQQASLGYVEETMRKNCLLHISSVGLTFNLKEGKQSVDMGKKFARGGSDQFQLVGCRINFETVVMDSINVTTVYSSFGIRNECNHQLSFLSDNTQYSVGPLEWTILPASFSKFVFVQGRNKINIQLDKTKYVYGEYLKFSIVSRLDNRVTVIKVEPRYLFINNSKEIIQIENNSRKIEAVQSCSSYQIYEDDVREGSISLIFGKYHKKSISLEKKGVSFLQMEQLFFKLSLFGKDESTTLLLQDSKEGHLIINKLEDITVIARTHCPTTVNEPVSTVQTDNENMIQKLIKPKQQEEIGLFSWDNCQIELEFYYDAKNIEFKQKYTVDLAAANAKYSNKHIVHEQKNPNIIFILTVTAQKDSYGRYTITIHKQKEYLDLPVQKMKVVINQISLVFCLSADSDSMTIECYKACIIREKEVEMSDIDLQVEKLLIRQGKNVSILSSLSNNKFIDCNLITNKTHQGTVISRLMVKVLPFEIICRERFIFLVLEKIVEIRAESGKKRGVKVIEKDYLEESSPMKSRWGRYDHSSKVQNDLVVGQAAKMIKLDRGQESELSKQLKGNKLLIIDNLQISETSIFLTYTKQEYRQFQEKIRNDRIIKYMVLMPPISELKINIPHLKINDFEGQTKQFMKSLIGKLRQSIGSTIANSFSSLSLFDSPIIAADGIFKYIEGMLTIL